MHSKCSSLDCMLTSEGLCSMQLLHQEQTKNRIFFEAAGEAQVMETEQLLQVALEFVRSPIVPQLAKDARLDLADALSRDTELLGDLFQRAGTVVHEAVAHLEYLALAVVELLEDVL